VFLFKFGSTLVPIHAQIFFFLIFSLFSFAPTALPWVPECLVVSQKPPFGFPLVLSAFDKDLFRFSFVLIIRSLVNYFFDH